MVKAMRRIILFVALSPSFLIYATPFVLPFDFISYAAIGNTQTACWRLMRSFFSLIKSFLAWQNGFTRKISMEQQTANPNFRLRILGPNTTCCTERNNPRINLGPAPPITRNAEIECGARARTCAQRGTTSRATIARRSRFPIANTAADRRPNVEPGSRDRSFIAFCIPNVFDSERSESAADDIGSMHGRTTAGSANASRAITT